MMRRSDAAMEMKRCRASCSLATFLLRPSSRFSRAEMAARRGPTRSDPLKKEFFYVMASDGKTLAGLVDAGSVPYFQQCATQSCKVVVADIATRQRLRTVDLPLLPVQPAPIASMYRNGPPRSAYSAVCGYLVVSIASWHKFGAEGMRVMRLWLP